MLSKISVFNKNEKTCREIRKYGLYTERKQSVAISRNQSLVPKEAETLDLPEKKYLDQLF